MWLHKNFVIWRANTLNSLEQNELLTKWPNIGNILASLAIPCEFFIDFPTIYKSKMRLELRTDLYSVLSWSSKYY